MSDREFIPADERDATASNDVEGHLLLNQQGEEKTDDEPDVEGHRWDPAPKKLSS